MNTDNTANINTMKNISVIIPTYNPSEKLLTVLHGLVDYGFKSIIVIDDGSRADCQKYFTEAEQIPECTVLHHEVNKGKGRGLKTGFNYVLEHLPDCDGVVTTDDDGQHIPHDIFRCAEKMLELGNNTAVLGARDFSGSNVPPKSKFGNNATRIVFRLLCGIKITDTQTGLRALPFSYLKPLTEVSGERFEYETNMLLEMKRLGLSFEEITIETIYLDNNSGTHFNPLTDSVKIYLQIIKYMASSLICSLIDIGLFTLVNMLTGSLFGENETLRILVATAAARIVSSFTNYMLNQRAVFRSQANSKRTFVRYYILCILQMAASFGLVKGAVFLFKIPDNLWQSVVKIVVDTLLFFASYGIQRDWVYSQKAEKKVESKNR